MAERPAVPCPATETAKPSPKHGEGAVCARWVRCGRAWCRCMRGGAKHGPYFARYWWRDGRRLKRYVRLGDAASAASACAERRAAECQARAAVGAATDAWRGMRDMIREAEHG